MSAPKTPPPGSKTLPPGERFPLTQDERTLFIEMMRAKMLHEGVMSLSKEILTVHNHPGMPNREKYVPGLAAALIVAEKFSELSANVAREATKLFWDAIGKRLGIDTDAASYEVDHRTMDVALATPEGDAEAEAWSKRRAMERVMRHLDAKGSA